MHHMKYWQQWLSRNLYWLIYSVKGSNNPEKKLWRSDQRFSTVDMKKKKNQFQSLSETFRRGFTDFHPDRPMTPLLFFHSPLSTWQKIHLKAILVTQGMARVLVRTRGRPINLFGQLDVFTPHIYHCASASIIADSCKDAASCLVPSTSAATAYISASVFFVRRSGL